MLTPDARAVAGGRLRHRVCTGRSREAPVNLRTCARWMAAAALADGCGLMIGGRAYAGLWRRVPGPDTVRRAAGWLAALPSPVLRLLGAGEAALGLDLLGRVPVPVPDLYRMAAPVYDAASPVWRRWFYQQADEAVGAAFREIIQPGCRVLDIGCGTGVNLRRILDLGLPFASYTGVDQSAQMLAQARSRFRRIENAAFERLTLSLDPLPEGPFDLVVSTWVFSHLPNPPLVVHEALSRLAGPRARVVLLFLADSESWQARAIRPIMAAMSARAVPEETYLAFPGRVRLDTFAGGSVALLVLRPAGSHA